MRSQLFPPGNDPTYVIDELISYAKVDYKVLMSGNHNKTLPDGKLSDDVESKQVVKIWKAVFAAQKKKVGSDAPVSMDHHPHHWPLSNHPSSIGNPLRACKTQIRPPPPTYISSVRHQIRRLSPPFPRREGIDRQDEGGRQGGQEEPEADGGETGCWRCGGWAGEEVEDCGVACKMATSWLLG